MAYKFLKGHEHDKTKHQSDYLEKKTFRERMACTFPRSDAFSGYMEPIADKEPSEEEYRRQREYYSK